MEDWKDASGMKAGDFPVGTKLWYKFRELAIDTTDDIGFVTEESIAHALSQELDESHVWAEWYHDPGQPDLGKYMSYLVVNEDGDHDSIDVYYIPPYKEYEYVPTQEGDKEDDI